MATLTRATKRSLGELEHPEEPIHRYSRPRHDSPVAFPSDRGTATQREWPIYPEFSVIRPFTMASFVVARIETQQRIAYGFGNDFQQPEEIR